MQHGQPNGRSFPALFVHKLRMTRSSCRVKFADNSPIFPPQGLSETIHFVTCTWIAGPSVPACRSLRTNSSLSPLSGHVYKLHRGGKWQPNIRHAKARAFWRVAFIPASTSFTPVGRAAFAPGLSAADRFEDVTRTQTTGKTIIAEIRPILPRP